MGIDNLEHVSQLFIELRKKPEKALNVYGSGFQGVPGGEQLQVKPPAI